MTTDMDNAPSLTRTRRRNFKNGMVFALPLMFMSGAVIHYAPSKPSRNRSLTTTKDYASNSFTQTDISNTIQHFRMFPPRMLLFEGETDTFSVYNVAHEMSWFASTLKQCERCNEFVPLVVDSLRRQFPHRFVKGGAPFQLFFTEADYFETDCEESSEGCNSADFVPMLASSALTKDGDMLPSVTELPNRLHLHCIRQWRWNGKEECNWAPGLPVRKESWEELVPQIVWRGSDTEVYPRMDILTRKSDLSSGPSSETTVRHNILNLSRLSPRWRAATFSLEAQKGESQSVPWIDCKFFVNSTSQLATSTVITNEFMDVEEMSKFKYQIDLGEGGDERWMSTLTKLAMPGVLFLVESRTNDWLYRELKPWVHYVPVKRDLSNLRERFDWAEANPSKARRMARAATKIYLKVTSHEYMKSSYEEVFVKSLRRMVEGYVPTENESVSSIMEQYQQDGFKVQLLSTCADDGCEPHSVNDPAPITLVE